MVIAEECEIQHRISCPNLRYSSLLRFNPLVHYNRSTQHNSLSIPPPLPQIIVILIAPTVHASVRANPVIRKLVVSRQSVLSTARSLSTSIKTTASIQPAVAIGSTRTRHGVQPVQVYAIVNTSCRSWAVPLLRQEEDMPQVREYASRDAIIARGTFGALV